MFDALPALCLEEISRHLRASCEADARCNVAATAAHLARTSRAFRDAFAVPLYDVIDAGCVAALERHRRVDLDSRAALPVEAAAPDPQVPGGLTLGSKAADLRAACAALGCASVSGTRAAMMARIEARVQAQRERGAVLRAAVERALRESPEPSMTALTCPVRPRARECVIAERRVVKLTATGAREMGLSEAHVDALPCETRRNPCYRNAAQMRLYREQDVLRALMRVKGPGDYPLTFDARVMARVAAEERRAQEDALQAKRTGELAEITRAVGEDVIAFVSSGQSGDTCDLVERFLGGRITRAQLEARLPHQSARLKRTRSLQVELRALGCELRDDSRLCAEYIDQGEGDPKGVAVVMCEMRFFHQHTAYASILDELYREERDHRDDRYDDPQDRDDRSEDAKADALQRWSDAHPSVRAACGDDRLPESLRQRLRAEETRRLVLQLFHRELKRFPGLARRDSDRVRDRFVHRSDATEDHFDDATYIEGCFGSEIRGALETLARSRVG